MQERQRRRRSALVVRVRYEPSRVAAACLADAYEQVVPVVRRAIGRPVPPTGVAKTGSTSWEGGIAG